MNKLIFAAAATLLVACPALCQQLTDRDYRQLRGPVQVVITESAKITHEAGKPVEGPRVFEGSMTFDRQGTLVEQVWAEPSGRKQIDTYSRGMLTSETYMPDGTPAGKTVRIFDERGRHLESLFIDAAGAVIKMTSAYDGKGRLVESQIFKADGTLSDRTVYVNDEKGDTVESISYNADGSVRARRTSARGEGARVETAHRDAAGEVREREVTNRWQTADGGTMFESAIYAADGSLKRKWYSVVDSRGREIEVGAYNGDGSVESKERFVYEDDSLGNWVKLTKLVLVTRGKQTQFEPETVSYRLFKYF